MIYITRYSVGPKVGKIASVQTEPLTNGDECRGDWKSFDQVQKIAEEATEVTGELHLGIDAGSHVHPRYDVVKAPKVGDKVSYAFNGDYYPCGEISSISKTLVKITTTTGESFYRRGKSAAWIKDGTWAMVPGHIDRLNPEF